MGPTTRCGDGKPDGSGFTDGKHYPLAGDARSLQWMAVIGNHRSSGIADHGTVRGIELSHPDHHPHGIGSSCMIGIALRPTTHDTGRDALLRELLHRAGAARR